MPPPTASASGQSWYQWGKYGRSRSGIRQRIWMVPFSVKTQEEKCDHGIVATLFMESGWKVGIDRIWSGIRPKNENGRIAFEQRLSGHRNAFRV